MNILVRGKYIITDPAIGQEGIKYNAAVYILNDKIQEVGDYNNLKKKYPNAVVKGNGKQLVMPGLINAHSHGAGLSPFQQGISYDYLENFLINKPSGTMLNPELNAKMCAIRHLRNGCTTLHHNQSGNDLEIDYVKRILDGYEKIGIRVAYSSGVRDANIFTYDDVEFYKSLPSDLQKIIKPIIFNDKGAFYRQYFDHFNDLYKNYNSEDRKIIFGPLWVQGCSDQFLKSIKNESDKLGKIPLHIHTLQTSIQKVFGEQKYGKSLLFHLNDLGLVDDNLVLGHAVFLTEEDIELLAEKNGSITHHASCNLAVRNGIAPVYFLHKAGVNVSLGIDDKGINDDEDPFMEMRLIYYLHRVVNYDLSSSRSLEAFDVLKMATVNAARVCNFNGKIGALKSGMKADLLLVNLDSISEDPWVNPCWSIVDLIIHRGKGTDVDTVIVNGRIIIENKIFCNFDLDSVYQEVRKKVKKGNTLEQIEFANNLQKLRPFCQAWYNKYFTSAGLYPFYKMNSKL